MAQPEVIVRELEASEHEALKQRIYELISQLSRRGPQPALIAEAFDDAHIKRLGAFIGGKLVGVVNYHYLVYYTDRVLYVNDVVVDATIRRNGVAKKLMDEVIHQAQALRCTGVDLRSAQPGAIKLYTKLKFIVLNTQFFRRPL